MTKSLFSRFAVRWLVSSLGLWVGAAILGEQRLDFNGSWVTIIGAGLLLALVNMALKPLLVILSFPAIILTLGLFMLAVNGFLVLLVSWLYSPLYVKNFWWAIVAGVIVGLVNFLVTRVIEDFEKK